MAYILDADWVINALAGRRQAAAILNHLAPEGIAISWITAGEVYEGAFNAPEPHRHLATFRQFLSPFRTLGVNDPIMERFAEIRSLLRSQGELISDFDILLAAMSLNYDLTVLTFNIRHFSRIPHLKLFQPS
jgi:tRNA(fMet)-specific endonuclease VapC